MPGSASNKVLRVAVIVDGESCEELRQTEPGDVIVGRASETGLGIGPSSALEYGAAAEGPKTARSMPLAFIALGMILMLLIGSWFAVKVNAASSDNVVLESAEVEASYQTDEELLAATGLTKKELEKKKRRARRATLVLLGVGMLGVVLVVAGTTMLRGRRRHQRRVLAVYDGHAKPRDYRAKAPIWLGVGVALVLGGGGLFAYEVSKHDPDAPIAEETTRGDMSAFKADDDGGTGGLGLGIALIGIVPLVIGAMGITEKPPRKRKRKPKGGRVPREHKLFEWVAEEGTYYINIPPETKGKLVLGKNKASVKSLRKRFGQPDGTLRVKLGPKAKGKLLLGQTRIMFQTAKPARAAALPTFPQQYADPFAHLRMSTLDIAAFGGVGFIALVLLVWFSKFADRTPPPPDERFVQEMGIPASFYEEEEEEVVEEEQEDTLKQEDKEEKQEVKEEKQLDEKLEKPKNVSEKAFKEARGVGVARVLGTWGGEGEGTVLDVIESTENNLGDLFAQGMTTTGEYQGGEIGDFVAGGGGIDATGTVASNEALQTGEGPAEVGKTEKKERKVRGKAKSKTGDVFGDVDKKAVSATIRRRMPGLQACYEKALRSNPQLKGKMEYTITINPSGRVTQVDIEQDTVGDSSVRTCTVGKIKGWRFFAEGAEESSEVTFSVNFTGS